jgi:hypothetical protein
MLCLFFKEKSCPYNRNSCLFICRVDAGLLLSTLCYRTIKTPEGNIIKAVDSSAAIIGRDTLAKTVYARLFDWYDCVSSCCFTFFYCCAYSVATAGLLTTLISPLGRTWSQGHRLGSWTSMVLSVSNITGQLFSLSFKTNKQRLTCL